MRRFSRDILEAARAFHLIATAPWSATRYTCTGMKLLTRYVLRELVGPTTLGFGFYTFMILMKTLFDFAEMIIKRSLPISTVSQLLLWSLPHIIVLTIPMALLFGILIAVGRLSADSEIIAMRAGGLSTASIYRPVFYFSLAIFLLNLYLMNVVLPQGNAALQDLKAEIYASSIENVTAAAGDQIRPGVFFDEYENLIIYVNDVEQATGAWRGVFISDTSEAERQNVIAADRGQLAFVEATRQVWLELDGVENHITSPGSRNRYDLSRNADQRFLLVDRFDEERDAQSLPRSLRELDVLELIERIRHDYPPGSAERRLALVEIHKKFSIPFACLAFGVIGLPLGITNRRGGKSSGFTLSILIILVYYVMINNGEDLARSGGLDPALAMWLPNIVLIGFGAFLMRRANRDMGYRGWPVVERIKGVASGVMSRRRERSEERRRSGEVSVLSRLDIEFPNLLDRYVLSQFFRVLGFVLVTVAVLFLVIDYTETHEEIRENAISFDVVLAYYRYFSIQVLNWALPLSVLFATLITFGILAKNNEITAAKAHGTSLYRISLPIVLVAVTISGLDYLLMDFVLPYSNQRMIELKETIRGKDTARAFSVQQKQWLVGKGRYLFNFLSYDERRQTLSNIQVFEFDDVDFRLRRRVFAEEARFDGVGWVFVNGWIRSFDGDGRDTTFSPIVAPIRLHYPERPEYFAAEVLKPGEMSYLELRNYIGNLKRSGYDPGDLQVQLYVKTSWPFITFVMALIALPFAFRLGKRGSLHGIGIALVVAVLYWMVFASFTKFGEVGNLPAILSAWSANILFGIAALYMFLHVET